MVAARNGAGGKPRAEQDEPGEGITSALIDKQEPEHQDQEELQPKPKKWRLQSLDTFRGIALTIMMFVNVSGIWKSLLVFISCCDPK